MKTKYISFDDPQDAIAAARRDQPDAALTATPTHDSVGRPAYLVTDIETGKKTFVIVMKG